MYTPEYIIINLHYNYVTMLKNPVKDVGPLQPFRLHVWRYVLCHGGHQTVLVREWYCWDIYQWHGLRASYHPDALKTHVEVTWFNARRPILIVKDMINSSVLDIQPFQSNIDGFVPASQAMTAWKGGAIYPIEVHVEGSKTLTESTASISSRFEHLGNMYDFVFLVRFSSGVHWYLWKPYIYRESIIPVTPCIPVGFHLYQRSRVSYKCVDWVLTQKDSRSS